MQIIPIRRCNIDCGYCNEYDKISPPVPTDVMRRRIDHLAGLGTSVVAFSGGEPMLHPDLDDLIRHIRGRGMMAGLITNGYFLVPKRIDELNGAGLDFLQISIDNVEPDEVSKKSLRVLDRKLQDLREHAEFDVNINSVLGGGIKNPEDARTINTRARELGFSTSIGIIHDGSGRPETSLGPGGTVRCSTMSRPGINGTAGSCSQNPCTRDHEFPDQSGGRSNRAFELSGGAARAPGYLYVRRGTGALLLPAARVPGSAARVAATVDEIRRERPATPKSWRAPHCTVGCVHRVSTMDFWSSALRTA